MNFSLRFRAAVVSIVLFAAFLGIWHLATRGTGAVANMTPEYAKLMGLTATAGKSAMPGPADVGAKLWEHLRQPFYDNGPNDKLALDNRQIDSAVFADAKFGGEARGNP